MSTRTYIKVVQTCTVDINEDLPGPGFGLGRVLRDGDLGRVGVVGHHKRAHRGLRLPCGLG